MGHFYLTKNDHRPLPLRKHFFSSCTEGLCADVFMAGVFVLGWIDGTRSAAPFFIEGGIGV